MRARWTASVTLLLHAAVILGLAGCHPPTNASPVPASAEPSVAFDVDIDAATATAPDRELYGYFRFANPAEFSEELDRRLVPPAFAGALDQFMLGVLIQALGHELGPDLIRLRGLDFTRPVGCVVAPPNREALPAACAFGYTGGFRQLVEDLGPDGYLPGGPNSAVYERGGGMFYLSTIDAHVVVATDPSLAADANAILRNDVVGSPADAGGRDVTATVFPAVLWKYEAEEMRALAKSTGAGLEEPTGNVLLDAYAVGAAKGLLANYRSLEELDRVELWADIDRRFELGYRGTARAGTPSAKTYAAMRALGEVKSEVLAHVPASAAVVSAFHTDPAFLMDDPIGLPYVSGLTEVDAVAGTHFRPALLDFQRLATELVAGPTAVSLFHSAKGSVGAGYVVALEPGVDARARIGRLLTKYSADAIGELVAKHVRWDLQRDAYELRGLQVDVLSIRPTDAAKSSIFAGPHGRELEKAFGARPVIKIAFAQQGDTLLVSLSGDDDKGILKQLIADPAARAVGVVSAWEGWAGRYRGAGLLVFVDVAKALRVWYAIEGEPKQPTMDSQADDLVFSGRVTADGSHEYVLSGRMGFMTQLRDL